MLTIDRKNLTSVTLNLPTPFLFLTNEFPRLTDSSGAFAGRRWPLPDDVQHPLFAHQPGIFKHWESPTLVIDIIGGVEDHVHAQFRLSKNHALQKIVAAHSGQTTARQTGTVEQDGHGSAVAPPSAQ